MATWTLSNLYKKSIVEKHFWRKDDNIIIMIEGYRWGTWTLESEEKPDIDLENEDDYEIGGDEYDWEMQQIDDGCWMEWEFPKGMDEEEQERIQELWNEDFYEGLENDGWENIDTEHYIQGPLQLKNEDTGEIFTYEEEENNEEE
jgi:hypothetical protein